MHPILEEFFNEKEMEERKKRDKEKEELLIRNELFEKVYSDKGGYSTEFSRYDQVEQKWYKSKPIDVTDEEYEKIKKYSLKTQGTVGKNGNNTISAVLKVVAWIVFIIGFFIGVSEGLIEVSFLLAVTYWIVAFISGILLLGLSEIIRLLNDIKNK